MAGTRRLRCRSTMASMSYPERCEARPSSVSTVRRVLCVSIHDDAIFSGIQTEACLHSFSLVDKIISISVHGETCSLNDKVESQIW